MLTAWTGWAPCGPKDVARPKAVIPCANGPDRQNNFRVPSKIPPGPVYFPKVCGSILMPPGRPPGCKTPANGVEENHRMSFTVFLGNLPVWVTADDIRGWLAAESLVADAIKVIRNPETQESKGFAFIEAPNAEEMHSIIRRFDRAPLEDRLLRANPAQPPKSKGQAGGQAGGPAAGAGGHPSGGHPSGPAQGTSGGAGGPGSGGFDRPRRAKKNGGMKRSSDRGPQSAFAEELAKAL